MAPRATTMAPTLARSTATGSKRRTSFLSLLLLPLCQALPQPAESQDWLARWVWIGEPTISCLKMLRTCHCQRCWLSMSEIFQTAFAFPICNGNVFKLSHHLGISRSTCVLDALAPGGVVDSQKLNDCMDCWRRFPFKSHLKINREAPKLVMCVSSSRVVSTAHKECC